MEDKQELGQFALEDEIDYLGFVQIPVPVLFDKRLSHPERIMYAVLRRYARRDDYCFPSVDRLTKGLGVTRRMIFLYVKTLEKCGLVVRQRRIGHSNIYKIRKLDKVYGNEGVLRDDIIEMLRDVGEETVADTILKRRGGEILSCDDSDEEVIPKPEKGKVVPRVSVRKWEETTKAVSEKRGKSEVAALRRKQRRKILTNDPYHQKAKVQRQEEEDVEVRLSIKDVEEEWRAAAKIKWPDITVQSEPWMKKGNPGLWYGVAGDLCKKKGAEQVIELVIDVIQNWERYSDDFKLKGYPDMKLLAYFADSWFADLQGNGPRVASSKKNRLRDQGEYDAATGTKNGGISF